MANPSENVPGAENQQENLEKLIWDTKQSVKSLESIIPILENRIGNQRYDENQMTRIIETIEAFRQELANNKLLESTMKGPKL